MKNLRAILLLFLANSISGIAQGISMIAIPWYFAQQQDTQRFGLIFIIANILSLVWVPYCGVFIDRYNRRSIFLIMTVASGVLLGGVALYGYQSGALPWYAVAAVFAFTFLNYNLHYPNLYAFAQEITEPRYYGRVTSLIEIQGQFASMLAGAGAAMLLEGTTDGQLTIFGMVMELSWQLEPWSITEIIAMDALTYGLAFGLILLIRYQSIAERKMESGSLWQRLKVGYQYLIEQPGIFIFGIASHSIFVTVLITSYYLGAIYTKEHLQTSGAVFASSELFFAFGSLMAGLAIRAIFRRINIPLSIIVMTAGTACLFAIFTLTKQVWIFYIGSFLLGLSNAGTRIQRIVYLFKTIPNQIYGRATSVFRLINILFRISFLSLFALSFFHGSQGITYAYGTLGLFLLITLLILLFHYRKYTTNRQP